MRFLSILTTVFLLILLMGYEYFDCHQKFDTKGPFAWHQTKCTKFKQEAQRRRANFSLTKEVAQMEISPIAGGSNFPGALQIQDTGAERVEQQAQGFNIVSPYSIPKYNFDTAYIARGSS